MLDAQRRSLLEGVDAEDYAVRAEAFASLLRVSPRAEAAIRIFAERGDLAAYDVIVGQHGVNAIRMHHNAFERGVDGRAGDDVPGLAFDLGYWSSALERLEPEPEGLTARHVAVVRFATWWLKLAREFWLKRHRLNCRRACLQCSGCSLALRAATEWLTYVDSGAPNRERERERELRAALACAYQGPPWVSMTADAQRLAVDSLCRSALEAMRSVPRLNNETLRRVARRELAQCAEARAYEVVRQVLG